MENVLWRASDTFRGTIDPSLYKDYLLTMLFLKCISDAPRVQIPDGCDFDFLHAQRDAEDIGARIDAALAAIAAANPEKLADVFRNISFDSEANLGRTQQRNERLKNLLEDFAGLDLRPENVNDTDVIGNAYAYLIGQFAADAGKKAGEFYTPPEVSHLLAQLLAPQAGESICDPACGSGTLLIKCVQQIPSGDYAVYGQEANGATWALCMMNMLLHNINVTTEHIRWGDTLRDPQLLVDGQTLMQFDVVVANPPFSLDKWSSSDPKADRFNRFHRGAPPKSKGDFAFISHMIETTANRMGVIVPHGVLFRGGPEGKIRQQLLQENLLDAVIGLPDNLFYGTAIPAAILIFKRHKPDDTVLFIDASRDFEAGSLQNRLRDTDREAILAAYAERAPMDKYANVVTLGDIAENGYTLSIPRYVDTFEPEPLVDMVAVQAEIDRLRAELHEQEAQMQAYLDDLGL